MTSGPNARIRYRPTARADIRELLRHITRESGPDRANDYLQRLKGILERLATQPFMGRARPELAADLRSFPAISHVVFYHPEGDGIRIVRVLHGRRDVDRLGF